MTDAAIERLCERLEASHALDTPRDPRTGKLINPDGPEAAALIRTQAERIKAYSVAAGNDTLRDAEVVAKLLERIKALEGVETRLQAALDLINAIDVGYALGDVSHEDFRVQVKKWTDAFLNPTGDA